MASEQQDCEQHAAAQRRALVSWSGRYPGVPLAQGAALVGVPVRVAEVMLGDRARLHMVRPKPSHRRYSDAELVDAVWEHVTGSGENSAESYRRAANEHGWPSLDTVLRRLGTWREVLAAAGVPKTRPMGVRGPAVTDAELRVWAAAYLADAPEPSWRDMDAWLHTHGGPTATTVRRRLGRWADMIAVVARSPLADDKGATPGQ